MVGNSPELSPIFERGISRRKFLQAAAMSSLAILLGVSFEGHKRINGLNFPSWKKGEYQTQPAIDSLNGTAEVSPNLIGFKVTQYQRDIGSTEIFPTDNTADFADLAFGIKKAQVMGYKTMLSPQINLLSSEGWHGDIGANFSETEQQAWFDSYRQMIRNYAGLAQELRVDMFVVGNEYAATSKRWPQDWQAIVSQVRSIYRGPLTYAAHYINEFKEINWWPELDLLGLNPYYELNAPFPLSREGLQANWSQLIADEIEPVVFRWNKDLIFPEIGYLSAQGASRAPWQPKLITDPKVPFDDMEQALCYQAIYEAFWLRPWWKGVVWWHWNTDPQINGLNNKEYSPRGKTAAAVIKHYSS